MTYPQRRLTADCKANGSTLCPFACTSEWVSLQFSCKARSSHSIVMMWLLLALLLQCIALSTAGAGGCPSDSAPDPCTTVYDVVKIPRVALMFIVLKDVPHERIWKEWLQDAAHLVPVQHVQQLCSSKVQQRWSPQAQATPLSSRQLQALVSRQQLCSFSNSGPDVYRQQALFSIYVHANPEKDPEFPPESLFHNRLIRQLRKIRWFSWSFVQAMKALVAAALCDPQNQRFVFVSDACVPLYPPSVLYQQLMQEDTARVDACDPVSEARQGVVAGALRWQPQMAGTLITENTWRKSSTWTALNRPVAQVFSEETKVAALFAKHCNGQGGVDCPPEEHYLPTMLAVMGLEANTSCSWGIAYSSFAQFQNGHADEFPHIDAQLLATARHAPSCLKLSNAADLNQQQAAVASLSTAADQLFLRLPNDANAIHTAPWMAPCEYVARLAAAPFEPVHPSCPLLMRKIPSNSTQDALHALRAHGVLRVATS